MSKITAVLHDEFESTFRSNLPEDAFALNEMGEYDRPVTMVLFWGWGAARLMDDGASSQQQDGLRLPAAPTKQLLLPFFLDGYEGEEAHKAYGAMYRKLQEKAELRLFEHALREKLLRTDAFSRGRGKGYALMGTQYVFAGWKTARADLVSASVVANEEEIRKAFRDVRKSGFCDEYYTFNSESLVRAVRAYSSEKLKGEESAMEPIAVA